MSKEEMTVDILLFLAQSDDCGIGKPFSMRAMVSSVAKNYLRFKKLYNVPQREQFTRRHIESLIREGKVIVTELRKDRAGDPMRNVANNDNIMIPKAMHTLRTIEGVKLAAPFFNDQILGLRTLSQRGITTTAMEEGEQDLRDLRMFLEFSHLWDRPLVFKDLVDYYMQSIPKQRKQMNTIIGCQRLTTAATGRQYPTVRTVSELLTNFLGRLQSRRVIVQQGRFYEVDSIFRKGLMALLTTPIQTAVHPVNNVE